MSRDRNPPRRVNNCLEEVWSEKDYWLNRGSVVTPKVAARLLNKSHNTLRDWRRLRIGPAFVRFRNRVLYRLAALDAFLEAHTVQPLAA